MKESASQFQLLRSSRFLPLFLTQFLGAFNDNLFKNTLIVLLVSAGTSGQFNSNLMINLAAGLFVLPFFLLSPLAGQVADKYEKSMLIRRVKLAEIAVMALAVAMLTYQIWWGLLIVLFLMGVQSTFFGPLKFSILPQHLQRSELVAGNAQVEMGTFVAILLGTLLGTMGGGMAHYLPLMGTGVIVVSVLGYLSSRYIPVAEPQASNLHIRLNPFVEMVGLLRIARQKKAVWLAILGNAWFWFLGSAYLTQTPNFAVITLHGGVDLIALLLCTFTVGIAGGSLLCDRLSGHKVEIGLVPLGSLGLSLFGIDLYFASGNYAVIDASILANFFTGAGSLRILVDLLLLGAFAGLYVVPLNAMIQARTPEDRRARVIACSNVVSALFMVLASVFAVVLLTVVELSIPEFLLIIALVNIVVALFIYQQVPEFTMRFVVWLLSHSLYRVKHRGMENIPEKGAAMLVCNHVSYMDALVLAGAIPRPVRFVMYKPIYEKAGIHYIFRAAKTIPICSPREDRDAYIDAMNNIAEALRGGELVCMFPEGKLTTDGNIDEFRPGIQSIIETTPVAVIPMGLSGLWGSFFSYNGGLFKGKCKPFSPLQVVVGAAIAPEEVSAKGLRRAVTTLRGDTP